MVQDVLHLARSIGDELKRSLQSVERQWQTGVASGMLAREINHALSTALSRLHDTGFWGPSNRLASNEFWQIAEPWLKYGELQVHARTKPRGYAGDFEMLEKICNRFCCEHPLGRVMDEYFQQQAAPQAVRDRTQLLTEELILHNKRKKVGRYRIVSVGSGPAREIRSAIDKASTHLRTKWNVTLLDLDQNALDFAMEAVTPSLEPHGLSCIRTNLSRLPRNAKLAAELAPADFLFSSGFFDYLEDPAARDMLAFFWRCLAPGGQFRVYNFAPANTSRAYMEWIGNWYLNYRNETDLRKLAVDSGIEPLCIDVRRISHDNLIELVVARPA